MTSPSPSPARRRLPAALIALLGAAFLLRLLLAAATPGYPYDTGTFYYWATALAENGPAAFYTSGFFADYPPGYLYLLWAAGEVLLAMGSPGITAGAMAVLCFVPILCDLALAVLLWHLCRRRAGERAAFAAAAAVAFNPAFLFDCAVWKQVDAVLALALAVCFLLLAKKRWYAAALAYAAALLIKPQALVFGPPFALVYLLAAAEKKEPRAALCQLGRTLVSALVCIGAMLLVSAPFTGSQTPVLWLIEKYTETSTSYPYASVNAFNFIALLGGNWQSETARFLLLRWKDWGTLAILLLSAALAVMALRAQRRGGGADPVLLAAFYGSGIFLFAHRMHERYLFPALALLLTALARSGDRRLRRPAALFSLSLLANMAAVYLCAESDPFLEGDAVRWVMRAAAAAALLGFVLLARACWQICSGRPAPEPAQRLRGRAALAGAAQRLVPPAPEPIPRWSRRDTAALLLLTTFAGCISLPYLGTRAVPQTSCTGPITAEIALPADTAADSVWIYPGIAEGTLTLTDSSGQTVCSFTLSGGSCFSWQRQELLTGETSFTLTLTGGTVNELVFADADGQPIEPVFCSAGAEALFDEPDTLPERPSQLNGMYFDEIYHGRTGFETLHGLPIYETTHPPLGKDLIALGIALFGMNPFGWRIMGALFGVAMVPVFYLLARGLLGRTWLSAALTLLFSLDFMRYTQSRIATIDVFVVFFILLSAACLVRFCRRFLASGRRGALVPAALGGISFGLACASKWTGLYAGAGFAAVYFLTMALRWRSVRGGPQQEEGKKDLRFALWAGFLFYAVLPLMIYIASYLPIQLGSGEGFSLSGIWQAQLSMFRYHSQLTATHPFESRWYTWPLILRPVWYYMGSFLPAGTVASIAALGSPVVWWGGLAGLIWTALRLPGADRSRQASRWFILLLYAAQLLPWVFVGRATFIYHYFPAMPFALLGLGAALDRLASRRPAAAKRLTVCLCGAAAVLFVFFFPVLSGLPIPSGYAALLKWLPGWSFYLL